MSDNYGISGSNPASGSASPSSESAPTNEIPNSRQQPEFPQNTHSNPPRTRSASAAQTLKPVSASLDPLNPLRIKISTNSPSSNSTSNSKSNSQSPHFSTNSTSHLNGPAATSTPVNSKSTSSDAQSKGKAKADQNPLPPTTCRLTEHGKASGTKNSPGLGEKVEQISYENAAEIRKRRAFIDQVQEQIKAVEDPKNERLRKQVIEENGLLSVGYEGIQNCRTSEGLHPEPKESCSVLIEEIGEDEFVTGACTKERVYIGSGEDKNRFMTNQDQNDSETSNYADSFLKLAQDAALLIGNVPAAQAETLNVFLSALQPRVAAGTIVFLNLQYELLQKPGIINILLVHSARAAGQKGALIFNIALTGAESFTFFHSKRIIVVYVKTFTLAVWEASSNWTMAGTGISRLVDDEGSCSTESASFQEFSLWKVNGYWTGEAVPAAKVLEGDLRKKWDSGALVALKAAALLIAYEEARPTKHVSEEELYLKFTQEAYKKALDELVAHRNATQNAVQSATILALASEMIAKGRERQRVGAGASKRKLRTQDDQSLLKFKEAQSYATGVLAEVQEINSSNRDSQKSKRDQEAEASKVNSNKVKERVAQDLREDFRFMRIIDANATAKAFQDAITFDGEVPIFHRRALPSQIVPRPKVTPRPAQNKSRRTAGIKKRTIPTPKKSSGSNKKAAVPPAPRKPRRASYTPPSREKLSIKCRGCGQVFPSAAIYHILKYHKKHAKECEAFEDEISKYYIIEKPADFRAWMLYEGIDETALCIRREVSEEVYSFTCTRAGTDGNQCGADVGSRRVGGQATGVNFQQVITHNLQVPHLEAFIESEYPANYGEYEIVERLRKESNENELGILMPIPLGGWTPRDRSRSGSQIVGEAAKKRKGKDIDEEEDYEE